jgi:phosphotriesterase-related protein
MKVNSVSGPLDPRKLGPTLMHEHVYSCCDWSMRIAFRDRYCQPDVLLEIAVAQLKKAREFGIQTIVDGTPINLGRDIHGIQQAAEQSGMNIIVSSGFYFSEDFALKFRSEDEIYDLIMSECQNGMEDTGILPGILKCAVDEQGFTPFIEKVLKATARAAAATGLPVFCHTIADLQQGSQVLDIFEACCVPLQHVIVGHSGDSDNSAYHESLLRRGCYLGMDRFGFVSGSPATTLEKRTQTVFELCQRGWSQQLFLSQDFAPYFGAFEDWEEIKRTDYLHLYVDFTYIHQNVLPLLNQMGASPNDLDHMLVNNAATFFEMEPVNRG